MLRFSCLVLVLICADVARCQMQGYILTCSTDQVSVWTVSSGYKVKPETPVPTSGQSNVFISAACNEAEAVQVVVTPSRGIKGLTVQVSDLVRDGGAVLKSESIDILRVRYVTTTIPTDRSTAVGQWPDPLPPFDKEIDVAAGMNQPLWIRVTVPADTKAGVYFGVIKLRAEGFKADVPVQIRVYGFGLPDKMSCTTAFGFSASEVFRYHNLTTEKDKRLVLDKYLANFAAHRISPYNPAPMDGIKVTWPDIVPPPSRLKNWDGVRIVSNESRKGEASLLIFDDDKKYNTTVSYKPLIAIPKQGLVFRFAYKAAIVGQRSLVTVEHYDAKGKWMSGRNNDIPLVNDGSWKEFSLTMRKFPAGAKYVRLRLRAARWSDAGEHTGLVWFDDVSMSNAETKEEYIEGGDFESAIRTEPLLPADKLEPIIDFGDWDKAMARAIDYYNFNSFRFRIPGIGGGTYHALTEPDLLGFGEDTPEYPIMFDSYCRQVEKHLIEKGWVDQAYVYWFDEPGPDQYAFVKNGFDKLKRSCPRIDRMLTEQPEPPLYGGPNIYCVISNLYNHDKAEQRREDGDRFWWYICTGPKAPYCTLFTDHPGTELRVWLWQTWKRNIEGILIWQTNYWTSAAAYPDPANPQNPYEDPMGWTSGYSTPAGKKIPWGNGDGRFIYPPEAAADGKSSEPVLAGPVDSIRWEMLRDGVEDYEYLTILKKLLADKKNKLSKRDYNKYSQLLDVPESISRDLTHFTTDPTPIENQRHKIAQAIELVNSL